MPSNLINPLQKGLNSGMTSMEHAFNGTMIRHNGQDSIVPKKQLTQGKFRPMKKMMPQSTPPLGGKVK